MISPKTDTINETIFGLLNQNPLNHTEICKFYRKNFSISAKLVSNLLTELAEKRQIFRIKAHGQVTYYIRGQDALAKRKIKGIRNTNRLAGLATRRRYMGSKTIPGRGITLLDHFKPNKRVKIKELMEKTGYHYQTIHKTLKSFVDAGIILKEKGEPGGRGLPPNVYRLNKDSPYKVLVAGHYDKRCKELGI